MITYETLLKWKREAITLQKDIEGLEGAAPILEVISRLILTIQDLQKCRKEGDK